WKAHSTSYVCRPRKRALQRSSLVWRPLTEDLEMADELNSRQRLELALLCADYDEVMQSLALKDADAAKCEERLPRALVPIIRYIRAEGITPEQFQNRKRLQSDSMVLTTAFSAALMVKYPHDADPGSTWRLAMDLAEQP